MASSKKKPYAVRLGKGVFIDVILHQSATREDAEKWLNRYKTINQRNPLLKLLSLEIINLLEK